MTLGAHPETFSSSNGHSYGCTDWFLVTHNIDKLLFTCAYILSLHPTFITSLHTGTSRTRCIKSEISTKIPEVFFAIEFSTSVSPLVYNLSSCQHSRQTYVYLVDEQETLKCQELTPPFHAMTGLKEQSHNLL